MDVHELSAGMGGRVASVCLTLATATDDGHTFSWSAPLPEAHGRLFQKFMSCSCPSLSSSDPSLLALSVQLMATSLPREEITMRPHNCSCSKLNRQQHSNSIHSGMLRLFWHLLRRAPKKIRNPMLHNLMLGACAPSRLTMDEHRTKHLGARDNLLYRELSA
jgi:hypothetical protein